MKVLIIGYGKMGREVEQLLRNTNHEIVGKIDDYESLNRFDGSSDVAIEFTTPSACVSNIYWCLEHKIPVVVGTTGWYDRLEEVQKACKVNDGAIVWGSNFSIGMNIVFQLNRILASFMNYFDDYECQILEIHHTEKIDRPSGTAIKLANLVIDEHHRYNKWELDPAIASIGVIPIHSKREGDVKGLHVVKWKGLNDEIYIGHEAFNRRGFAIGAIKAAEWIIGKKGMFSFSEYFREIIQNR